MNGSIRQRADRLGVVSRCTCHWVRAPRQLVVSVVTSVPIRPPVIQAWLRSVDVIDITGPRVRLLSTCTTTNSADASSNHTLAGGQRCFTSGAAHPCYKISPLPTGRRLSRRSGRCWRLAAGARTAWRDAGSAQARGCLPQAVAGLALSTAGCPSVTSFQVRLTSAVSRPDRQRHAVRRHRGSRGSRDPVPRP